MDTKNYQNQIEPIVLFVYSTENSRSLARHFMESLVNHGFEYPEQGLNMFGDWIGLRGVDIDLNRVVRVHIVYSETIMQHFKYEWHITHRTGCIVLIDSAAPQDFQEILGFLSIFRFGGIPLVIVALNQEHSEAWSIADLRTAFRRPQNETVPFLPCDINSISSVQGVVKQLLWIALGE